MLHDCSIFLFSPSFILFHYGILLNPNSWTLILSNVQCTFKGWLISHPFSLQLFMFGHAQFLSVSVFYKPRLSRANLRQFYEFPFPPVSPITRTNQSRVSFRPVPVPRYRYGLKLPLASRPAGRRVELHVLSLSFAFDCASSVHPVCAVIFENFFFDCVIFTPRIPVNCSRAVNGNEQTTRLIPFINIQVIFLSRPAVRIKVEYVHSSR